MRIKIISNRFLIILLCMVLCAGCLAGCGRQAGGEKASQEAFQTGQTNNQTGDLINSQTGDRINSQTGDQPDAQALFDELCRDYFRDTVTGNTLDLHYTLEEPEAFGIRDYPVTLGPCSQAQLEAEGEEARNWRRRLQAIVYEDLSQEDQVTYDILENELDLEIEGLNFPYYAEPLKPVVGIQTELPILLAEYSFNRIEDLKDYMLLLGDMRRYYGDLLAYEEEKADRGLFMSDGCLEMVIADLDALIDESGLDFLYETFEEKLDKLPDLSKSQKRDYRDANERLLKEEVLTAMENLRQGLLKLKGKGKNEVGLSGLPDGLDYYEYLVQCQTGSDRGIENLEEMTEKDLDDNIEYCDEIVRKHPELADQMRDFSFTMTDPEDILADLRVKMQEDYPDLGQKVDLSVKKVSPCLEENSSPAFYLASALDNPLTDTIYINEGRVNHSELYTTLAHEGYPGHLYEHVYFNLHNENPVRMLLTTPGYSEGWATYVEQEAYYYDQDQDKDLLSLMQHNGIASLAMYAMADYYIHYEGFTPEDIRIWLYEYYGEMEEDQLEEFYNTVLSQPCNYLNYYVGYLEFKALREEKEKALGKDFSLKDFHRSVLNMGNMPFYILKEHMQ